MRKTQNAQAVTEKKLDPENKVDTPAPSPNNKPAGAIPIDLSSVDPAKIKMAEGFGIPIGQILSWMQSVEEFKQITIAKFEELEKIAPTLQRIDQAISEARKNQPQQPQEFQVPQNPGAIPQMKIPSWLEGFMTALPTLAQQQPQNNMLTELSEKALRGQIAMSEAITNAVVSKIASRATDAVADAVTGA